MVSPGPSLIETKKIKRLSRYRLAHQPVDLREGVAKAYSVVKEVRSVTIAFWPSALHSQRQGEMPSEWVLSAIFRILVWL